MYCSPRLATYGFTLRGPASRLLGSTPSSSSRSAPVRGGGRTAGPAGGVAARTGAGVALALLALRAAVAAGLAASGRAASTTGRAGARAAGRTTVAPRRAASAAGRLGPVRRVEAGVLRASVRCAAGLRAAARTAGVRAGFRAFDAGFLLAISRSLTGGSGLGVNFRARDYTDGYCGVQCAKLGHF